MEDLNVTAIVIYSNPAWFCDTCKKAHHILYVENIYKSKSKHYCPLCVPQDVKDKAEYVDQCRKKVDYVEPIKKIQAEKPIIPKMLKKVGQNKLF